MATTWSGAGFNRGTTNGGVIDTLAPIPDGYNFIKGQSWNRGSNNNAHIFGDIYGYAVRTSRTTADVYLCQRGWVYNSGAANYATWKSKTGNNVVRSSDSSLNYMWGYNSTASFGVTGSTAVTFTNSFRWGSSNQTYSPYGGSLYIGNSSSTTSWWKQLFTITEVPVNPLDSKVTLNFGAASTSGTPEFEVDGKWSVDLPIKPAVPEVYSKIGTAWKLADIIYTKIGNAWKEVTDLYVKVSSWKRSN